MNNEELKARSAARLANFKQDLAALLLKYDASIECETKYCGYEGYGALTLNFAGKYTENHEAIYEYEYFSLPNILDKDVK